MVPKTTSGPAFSLFWDLELGGFDLISPTSQPTELPHHRRVPHTDQSRPLRPLSKAPGRQDGGAAPSRRPLLLGVIFPAELTWWKFPKLMAAPNALGDGPNKLPGSIALPLPIGAILIEPFPGTSVKEKAICSMGFWLRHLAISSSPPPSPSFPSPPLHPHPPGPFTCPCHLLSQLPPSYLQEAESPHSLGTSMEGRRPKNPAGGE